MRKRATLSSVVLLCLISLSAVAKDIPGTLRIEGNFAFSDETLWKHLSDLDISFEHPEQLTPDERGRIGRLIRQYHQDRGYPLTRAEAHMVDAQLEIRVWQGPLARLGWVLFIGNTGVEADKLEDFFPIGKRLDFNDLELCLDRVGGVFRDRGYPLVTVQRSALSVVETETPWLRPLPWLLPMRRRHRIRLEIAIDTGPQFRIGQIQLPPEIPAQAFELPEAGDTYDAGKLMAFSQAVRTHFFEQGRLLDRFEILQYMNQKAHSVDLQVKARLLPPLDVSRIIFDGNDLYPDHFYRRELKFEEQDPLDPRRIAAGVRALNSLGVLKKRLTDDDVQIDVDEKSQTAKVRFALEEKKRHSVVHSLSRTEIGGFESRIVYTVANLFGLGEKLGLELNSGGGVTGGALTLASRYLLGTDIPMEMALKVFRRHTGFKLSSVDDAIRHLLSFERTGFSFTTAYHINHLAIVGAEAGIERFCDEACRRHYQARPFLILHDGETSRLILDTRFSIFSEQIHSWNVQPRVEYRWQEKALEGEPRFSLGFEASLAQFFGGKYPLSERIFNDSDTVRGFPSTTSGPWGIVPGEKPQALGGDLMTAVHLDWEVPVAKSRLAFNPFLDLGGVAATSAVPGRILLEGSDRVVRLSAGAEVKFPLPLGLPRGRVIASWNPLRLDRIFDLGDHKFHIRDPRTALRFALDDVR